VRVELEIDDGAVRNAAFTANACAICTAAASLLTVQITGASTREASLLSDAAMLAALGGELPPARLACATLPLRAMRTALAALPAPA
jgi:NifU-like protein involved in Fe-S cluster formation